MIKSILNGGAIYFRVKLNTPVGHLAVAPKGNSLLDRRADVFDGQIE
jgi:hypothetical protein